MAQELNVSLQSRVDGNTGGVKDRYQELLDLSNSPYRGDFSKPEHSSLSDRIRSRLEHAGFTSPLHNLSSGTFFSSMANIRSLSSTSSIETQRKNSESRLAAMGMRFNVSKPIVKEAAEKILSDVKEQLTKPQGPQTLMLKDWAKMAVKALLDRALEVVSEPLHDFVHSQIDRLEALSEVKAEKIAIEKGVDDATREFADQLFAELTNQDLQGNLRQDVVSIGVDAYVENASMVFNQLLLKRLS